MGRWSADHWKTATLGWLAFVIVAFGLGGLAGMKTIDPNTPGRASPAGWTRSSTRASSGRQARVSSSRAKRYKRHDPAFKAAVEDVVSGISNLNAVQNVRSPLESSTSGQISEDGRSALVEFEIRGDSDDAADKIGPVLERVDEIQKTHPQFFIGEFGDASAVNAVETAYEDDLGKAGLLSLPVALRHPRARVRGTSGCRHSAVARIDRGIRDLRTDRPA